VLEAGSKLSVQSLSDLRSRYQVSYTGGRFERLQLFLFGRAGH
jgi:hypothetical protein